jgi:hypothetical protein
MSAECQYSAWCGRMICFQMSVVAFRLQEPSAQPHPPLSFGVGECLHFNSQISGGPAFSSISGPSASASIREAWRGSCLKESRRRLGRGRNTKPAWDVLVTRRKVSVGEEPLFVMPMLRTFLRDSCCSAPLHAPSLKTGTSVHRLDKPEVLAIQEAEHPSSMW